MDRVYNTRQRPNRERAGSTGQAEPEGTPPIRRGRGHPAVADRGNGRGAEARAAATAVEVDPPAQPQSQSDIAALLTAMNARMEAQDETIRALRAELQARAQPPAPEAAPAPAALVLVPPMVIQ